MTCTITEFAISHPAGTIYAKQWTSKVVISDIPVVLIHDSLGSVGLWRSFPEALAEAIKHPVIAYDRLGFGQSDARTEIPSPHFIEEEADYFLPHIKHGLNLKQYLLLGHSVGGGMSVNIAAKDSNCIGIITIAAQAYVQELTLQGIRNAKELFKAPDQLARLKKWHGEKATWVLNAWTEVWLSEAFATWGLDPVIESITCPVLALHGDADDYGTADFPKYFATRTSGMGEMILIEDCGHVPQLEKTDFVVSAIQSFLEKHFEFEKQTEH